MENPVRPNISSIYVLIARIRRLPVTCGLQDSQSLLSPTCTVFLEPIRVRFQGIQPSLVLVYLLSARYLNGRPVAPSLALLVGGEGIRPDRGSNPGLPKSSKGVLPLHHLASSWGNHQLQHFCPLFNSYLNIAPEDHCLY